MKCFLIDLNGSRMKRKVDLTGFAHINAHTDGRTPTHFRSYEKYETPLPPTLTSPHTVEIRRVVNNDICGLECKQIFLIRFTVLE